MKYLINKKIFIENKNKMGETPLHVAAKNNLKSIIIELINNGANIQSPDSLQITPLHYLARGFVIDCEKSYTENIIDDPKPKVDKKVISEMAKKVRDFYNDYLLKDFGKFELIENDPNAPARKYQNRLIDFFKHTKNAAKEIIKKNDSFKNESTQIANEIKEIAIDVSLSDEEKKLQNEKIRTDYYNKVFKMIKNIDVRFDKNIDLKATTHINEDGLILANKNGAYSNNPFPNYGVKNNNSFYKVNDEPTFNQVILQNIEENKQELLDLQNNIREDMDNLHNDIGTGVIQTCENLASFIYTVNFYQEIYRLNEFIASNPISGATPQQILNGVSPPLAAPRNLVTNKNSINIAIANNLNNDNFNEKYFMKYDPNAFPVNGARKDLDLLNQIFYSSKHEFNENVLTNKLNINNITSQNLTTNGDEIVIDLSNFNWNAVNPGAGHAFTLAINNKTTKTTTFISRDFTYNAGPLNVNNIMITSIEQLLNTWNPGIQVNIPNQANQVNLDSHLTANVVQGVNSPDIRVPKLTGQNSQPRLRKLLRFRIRKITQNRGNQNQTVSNILNLSLDYLSWDGRQTTLNFDPGQYQICFIASNAAIGATAFGAVGAPSIISNVLFDLSDFSENEITYKSFYVGAQPNQSIFIYTPLIALINQIKSSDIKGQMITSTNFINFINKDLIVNDTNINNFYNQLHKWYIRYYQTLNMYSEEFIRGQPIANIITEMMDKLNFKNNLQNQLYNSMYQNLVNNKVNLLEEINSEISTVRRRLERIINRVNNFVDLVIKRFDYYTMYQYFNEEKKTFLNQNEIVLNEDLKSIINLDNNHFFPKNFINIINLSNNNRIKSRLKSMFSKIYFFKYKNKIDIIRQNTLIIEEIGINFINYAGPQTNFTEVVYDPRILNSYFYLTRYRMIEEIVLDIHFESATNGSGQKSIYDMVKEYVTDNLGKIDPLMERPLILSIIGDLIDNNLISNVKKALYDAVTEIVNEKVRPNIATGTQISLITQSTTPVATPSNVEINYSAIDFDVEFGLNLGEQDDLVQKALSKIGNLNLDRLLELSFGDMLLSNKIKYKTEIGKETKEIVQQIFYPSDFLSSINSSQKCVIYDKDIINLINNKPLYLNKKDYYGNSALYYAINSQNYLFVKWLIDKSSKCIEIKNNDKQSPFIYILTKLKSICEYFGKDNNILNQLNKYYTLALKEEVNKLDNHGNIFKNLDMLVLLYLFLINSSFFDEMFKKDYNLLNKFKELYEDDKLEIKENEKNNNYQNDFNLIFRNPIHDIFKKNLNGDKFKFDVILNLKVNLEKKIKENEEKKKILENKINNYTSIQSLLMPTNISYSTNIEENKNKIDQEINTLQMSIQQAQTKIAKINNTTNIELNENFKEDNLGFTNIFDQIFEISKSYKNNELKDFNFNLFLKGLRKVSDKSDFIYNTYFFHNLISKFIINFIEYTEKILNQPYYEINDLKEIKKKLDKLIDVMKRTMYKSIFHKNNNVKNIDKNENLNKEFLRICFTIDVVVGNVFYKVLKRLMMTFLKTRYPVSDLNPDKFLKFIKEKVDKILFNVNKYIQPDISKKEYKPSELTKKMVLLVSGYKSSENEYSSLNEDEFFEFIISSIRNNGFEFINENDPLLKYLDKIFLPYFIGYYRICITKLTNVTNSYENYILSQYYNLNIFKLLLDNKIKPPSPSPIMSTP